MNQLQEFVYTRTYSRWIDELNRRENWPESVGRLTEFFGEQVPQIKNTQIEAVKKTVINMNVMPSMRAMWAAGNAAKSNHITLYNCFSGEERFITMGGIRSLRESVGEPIVVLTSKGTWKKAEVKEFGEQQLYRVTLKHYNGGKHGNWTHSVSVTKNHRWLLQDGTETTNLKIGDILLSPDLTKSVEPSKDAIHHGIVFGDGTLTSAGNKKYALVRLCGNKKHLLTFFKGRKVSYPPTYNGDPVVYLGNSPWLKSIPTPEMSSSPDYVLGFLQGLLATDGSLTLSGNIRIDTQNAELVEWLIRHAPVAGYKILSHKSYNKPTNYGKRKSPLNRILLGTGKAALLRVEAIEKNFVEKVYCVVEPTTKSFTLANGQVTGNCAFVAVNAPKVFTEILFILMCGTGVGFSVERQYIDELPTIKPRTGKTIKVAVGDSREGWAKAFEEVLDALWEGHGIDVDYSKVRPRGARLKTMGGRASGPYPLKNLFDFASKLFERRTGNRLQPLDCHDLVCKVAEIVVVGGVRRSSLISLSDLNDKQIATAKSGEFWTSNPHRSMSNNSAVYTGRPDMASFMREWITLIESGSGERGIFNRVGAAEQMKASGRREAWKDLGTNPCAEILLRDAEFCNLTEVVVRQNDTLDSLREKVRLATALGIWQATMTKFPYIRPQWQKNCEEERLLGVSLSGIMDNPVLNNINDKAKKWFADLKHTAIHEAKKWSKILEINMPAAITCVKPSGTVSQLVDCASGIHPRYSPYYIRRVRISATDPLFRMLRDQGVPCSPELGQEAKTASTWVLEFPVAAPKNAKTRHDFTALEQLEHWKMVKEFWCEHNPSITVYVDDSEWLDVGAWVYRNFDYVTGISFLPKQNHVYLLAPYEEVDEGAYKSLKEAFPKIDYSQLSKYENEDNTEGAKTYACAGDSCEIT